MREMLSFSCSCVLLGLLAFVSFSAAQLPCTGGIPFCSFTSPVSLNGTYNTIPSGYTIISFLAGADVTCAVSDCALDLSGGEHFACFLDALALLFAK
jgi:hypothetical protein